MQLLIKLKEKEKKKTETSVASDTDNMLAKIITEQAISKAGQNNAMDACLMSLSQQLLFCLLPSLAAH